MAQTRLNNACGERALEHDQRRLYQSMTFTNLAPAPRAAGNGLMAGSTPLTGPGYDVESDLRGLGSSSFFGCPADRGPTSVARPVASLDIRPRAAVVAPTLSNTPRYL